MNRRELLKLGAALGGATIAGSWLELPANCADRGRQAEQQAQESSLRAVAASRGIVFGAAIRRKHLINDEPYAQVVGQQCGILTPELELKWDMLRPTPDNYDFSGADWLYQFAQDHQMLFRGHTLVWDAALPTWFGSTVNTGNAQKILLEHIATAVGHFAGKMHSWDVVNEGIHLEDGRADGLKQTPWLRLLGPGYIETAFHAAHQADPAALLVYNENWLEPETDAGEQKRKVTLAMLTDLKKKNVPVHGLGVQSHIFAEANVTGPRFKRFLQEVADLGLALLVTEMDVRDENLPAGTGLRDRMVADQYYRYLSCVLECKALKTVATWGISDRYTWLTQSQPRRDKQPVRPLLYEADLRPAPAWGRAHQAFAEAVAR